MTDQRYPIGRFSHSGEITPDHRRTWIDQIAELPAQLRAAVVRLTDEQLDTPYRDGGWTVRQVVHHLADSHMNSLIRFKLALTEKEPTIKPYDENLWVLLSDAHKAPLQESLVLLEALHGKWVTLLQSLSDDQFARVLIHPVQGRIRLDTNLGIYAWHGRHHIAHITALRERMGW